MPDHGKQRFSVLVCSTFILIIALAACGGGSVPVDQALDATPEFRLDIQPETPKGDLPTGRFTLAVSELPDSTIVEIRAAGLVNLRACFFSLAYDDSRFNPQDIEYGPDWAPAASASGSTMTEPLCLTILNQPGLVHYGLVLPHPAEQAGLSGAAVVARVHFSNSPYFQRVTSAPPITDRSRTEVNWDSGSQTLTWFYDCQGDYNQDGLVTVTDLTPVGQHYDRTGPFDPADALTMVDGNEDGAITVSDITPIGQNFGRGVEGYDIFASSDPGDIPQSNDELPAIDPVGYVPFSEGYGNPLAQRLMFTAEFPGLSGDDILWVRPVSEAMAGTPENPDVAATIQQLKLPATHRQDTRWLHVRLR